MGSASQLSHKTYTKCLGGGFSKGRSSPRDTELMKSRTRGNENNRNCEIHRPPHQQNLVDERPLSISCGGSCRGSRVTSWFLSLGTEEHTVTLRK